MGKWMECMCEASKPFHALEHSYLLCRGFSAFWPAGFSTSSRPIVIFRLIIFRLVRHNLFYFFSSLSSLFVCSVFQGNHDESSALATQCETPCATRLSYHGIYTILRAIGTIYVIRKCPIPNPLGYESGTLSATSTACEYSIASTLAKKIETTARTWRRRVISRACTRLCLACVPVSIFFGHVSSFARIFSEAIRHASTRSWAGWVEMLPPMTFMLVGHFHRRLKFDCMPFLSFWLFLSQVSSRANFTFSIKQRRSTVEKKSHQPMMTLSVETSCGYRLFEINKIILHAVSLRVSRKVTVGEISNPPLRIAFVLTGYYWPGFNPALYFFLLLSIVFVFLGESLMSMRRSLPEKQKFENTLRTSCRLQFLFSCTFDWFFCPLTYRRSHVALPHTSHVCPARW